jgi:gamma-glutamyltranspeptidase
MELTICLSRCSRYAHCQVLQREWRSIGRRRPRELSGEVGGADQHNVPWLYRLYSAAQQQRLAVLEQLNMLEGYDLKALGHNSPEYLHLLGEVMRLAVADRNRYVGDPQFVKVPVDKLLSKDYAAERRNLIHLDSTMSVATAGDFGKPEETHTTHLNVVDAEGNMVALTQTLGDFFGSHVVAADTGVLLSDEMRHLHLDANDPSRLEPGKRSRSNESPIIILIVRMANRIWRWGPQAATASGNAWFT